MIQKQGGRVTYALEGEKGVCGGGRESRSLQRCCNIRDSTHISRLEEGVLQQDQGCQLRGTEE